MAPKGPRDSGFRSRLTDEAYFIGQTTWVKGKVKRGVKALMTNSVIHAYDTLANALFSHVSQMGRGKWTVLLCEVGSEGILAQDSTGRVGVGSLKPIEELGTFDSSMRERQLKRGEVQTGPESRFPTDVERFKREYGGR